MVDGTLPEAGAWEREIPGAVIPAIITHCDPYNSAGYHPKPSKKIVRSLVADLPI
jgi:hypothetical protein